MGSLVRLAQGALLVVLGGCAGVEEILPASSGGQQVDRLWTPRAFDPEWERDAGPRVGIDEAHHNFHTVDGRYRPFAELLRDDGFQVAGYLDRPSSESLEALDILVISNAMPAPLPDDAQNSLPTPSAFEASEVATLEEWVAGGGSLLLIADHMPIAGAAYDLGRAFGVHFTNGYTYGSGNRGTVPDLFTQSNGLLREHPVSSGRTARERIDSVATFVGNGFQLEDAHRADFSPILVFGEEAKSWMTTTWGEFTEQTPTVSSAGWLHGATRRFGDGRVAIFGEAAMFTAQVSGEVRMGMAHPKAEQNQQFVLNLLRWLAGGLD